jgi:hypothetical protein
MNLPTGRENGLRPAQHVGGSPGPPEDGFGPGTREGAEMREMNSRTVTIGLCGGTVIAGKINIGSTRRLSDFLNKQDNLFIVLFDVTEAGTEGGVVFVNRNQIVWARPVEDGPSVTSDAQTLTEFDS